MKPAASHILLDGFRENTVMSELKLGYKCVAVVHYKHIQTMELRRIKRVWPNHLCLCFSGKNKTTRCMKGTSPVVTTVQTSSCVQIASLWGNEQLRERSGLHPRHLPTAETSSRKNKQSFLLLPVKVICAARRLWWVKGCSHLKLVTLNS